RLQPDMRMRPDIHRLGGTEGDRAVVIQEAPRPDHPAPRARKRPADDQASGQRRLARRVRFDDGSESPTRRTVDDVSRRQEIAHASGRAALDRLLASDRRTVRVAATRPPRPSLGQQVPALVQGDLDPLEPRAIGVGHLAARFSLEQLVLLARELVDPPENVLVVHDDLRYDFILIFRKVRITWFVEASCASRGSDGLTISGTIRWASTLPSSTPHWSNESICQMAPCVNTMCSWRATSLPSDSGVSRSIRIVFDGRLPSKTRWGTSQSGVPSSLTCSAVLPNARASLWATTLASRISWWRPRAS